MMLYHVPDTNKGLSEVKRVLKGNGFFYCTTYGEKGITGYLASLLNEFGVQDSMNKNFTLQNGNKILDNYFSTINRLDYKDSLEITDINDILDYIYSLTSMTNIKNIERNKLSKILEEKMINGILYVPKEYGMFICEK